MQLSDATFIVTDTETTGVDANRNRIIEIAAVKVQGGQIVDRFAQLINPGCSVPSRITSITGISTGMLVDQPPTGDVLKTYLDFLDEGIFVAHNLPFDQRFIDAELARMDQPPLQNDGICTLRLARRLLKGLRSKSLASIATFYRLPLRGRHRALGDAETTAEVLLRFLSQIEYDLGIETLDDMLSFQHRRYAQARKEPKHIQTIRREVLPGRPARPGVYFMHDRRGEVIYIGKAKNLRSRVRSYFTAIESHAAHTRKLIETMRQLTWRETGSELSALLLESRLIKTQKPRFNRAQRRYRTRPFVRLEVGDPFPRISAQTYLKDDGAEYFGPLGGRRQAEMVVELINRLFLLRECDDATFARGHRCLYAEMGRCLAPCEPDAKTAYEEEVDRVRGFLTGKDRDVLDQLSSEMQKAAAALDFEQARVYRDWLQQLERLLDKQQCVATPVLDHNAVLVLPGIEADTVQLFLVRFGRHVETLVFPSPLQSDQVTHLRERLNHHFQSTQARPERYLKEEVDEVRLLAHWMYVYRNEIQQLIWSPDMALDNLLEAVMEKVDVPVSESDEVFSEA